jgi:hypothetical protein
MPRVVDEAKSPVKRKFRRRGRRRNLLPEMKMEMLLDGISLIELLHRNYKRRRRRPTTDTCKGGNERLRKLLPEELVVVFRILDSAQLLISAKKLKKL